MPIVARAEASRRPHPRKQNIPLPSLRDLLIMLRRGELNQPWLVKRGMHKALDSLSSGQRHTLVFTNEKHGSTYATREDLIRMSKFPEKLFLYVLGGRKVCYCPLTRIEIIRRLAAKSKNHLL